MNVIMKLNQLPMLYNKDKYRREIIERITNAYDIFKI